MLPLALAMPSSPLRSHDPVATFGRVLLALVITAALLSLGTLSAVAADGVITRGPGTHKTIALTFDDGYAPAHCLEIADTLTRYGVPATWFPNGVNVVSSAKVWKHIGKHFPMANHTYHHPSLVGMSAKSIRKELLRNQRAIEQVTGTPMTRILRPTYGAYNDRVLRVADELGYRVVNWDVSAADTSPHGTDRGIAKRALSGGPGSIILMHCGPDVTPRILPIIIARYACDGYRFVTLDDQLAGRRGVAARVTCPPPQLPARAGGAKAVSGVPDEETPPEQIDPDLHSNGATDPLARFLVQTPTWESCEHGLECIRIRVPHDHAAPDEGREVVRVYRVVATGDATSSLIIGPDSSGTAASTSLERATIAVDDTLREHFDLLAFDPRRGRDGGPMHPDDLARDLDLARRVLGLDHIDYYGSALGAAVGAAYAVLFPERVRSMVLDGPMDASLDEALTLDQALTLAGPDGSGDIATTDRRPLLILAAQDEAAGSGAWTTVLAERVTPSTVLPVEGAVDRPSYLTGNECVDAAVERYLIEGVVPEGALTCQP